MKILITLFVLLFSSSVIAEDITDFEIEGISIGDDITVFFSETQIIENTKIYHTNQKYITLEFHTLDFLKTYNALQLVYKSDDNIIHDITGLLSYEFNIEDCFDKMDIITNDILNSINVTDKTEKTVQKLRQDSSGKSEMTIVQFYFPSGEGQVGCYNWSIEKGWIDHLRVSISTSEFSHWSEKYLITKN